MQLSRESYDNRFTVYSNYKLYVVPDEIIEIAKEKVRQRVMGTMNPNGIRPQKERAIQGYVAQEMFKRLYPAAEEVDNLYCDFLLGSSKIDVKSRSQTIVTPYGLTTPSIDWDISIRADVFSGGSDFYVHTSVDPSNKYIIFLGFISLEDLKKKTKVKEKGSIQANGVIFKKNNLSLQIKDINNMDEFDQRYSKVVEKLAKLGA